MSTIAVIAAMDKEASLLKAMLSDIREKQTGGMLFYEGNFRSHRLILARCGIGKVCAAAAAVELIRSWQPDFMINTGAAGGIDKQINVMDIVAAPQTAYYDVFCGGDEGCLQDFPQYFPADEKLYQKALSSGAKGGLIVSGDRFITSADEVSRIKNLYPRAFAADMESAAVAQICYMYHVPFLSLRLISDTPGNTADHAVQYKDFWTRAGEHSFAFLSEVLS